MTTISRQEKTAGAHPRARVILRCVCKRHGDLGWPELNAIGNGEEERGKKMGKVCSQMAYFVK